jgi:hypothetical protein
MQRSQAQSALAVQRARAQLQSQLGALSNQAQQKPAPDASGAGALLPPSLRDAELQARRLQLQSMQKAMQNMNAMNAMLAAQLQTQAARLGAAPAAPPTLAQVWLSSSWTERVGSVWSAGLALLSLLGLICLAIAWRRGVERLRPLVWAACVLFGVYSAWHIARFAIDMG